MKINFKNKYVIGGIAIAGIAAASYPLVFNSKQPEDNVKTSEIKKTEEEMEKERAEALKEIEQEKQAKVFSSKDKQASDGTAISSGDYNLADVISVPSLDGVDLSVDEYTPDRNEIIETLKLNKEVYPIKDNTTKLERGDVVFFRVDAYINDEYDVNHSANSLRTQIGTKTNFEDYDNHLTGMVIDETKKITVTYPKDYSEDNNKAGKTIVYEIKPTEASRPAEPTEEEVEKTYQAALENARYANEYQKILKAKQYLKENSKIKFYPASLVEQLETEFEKTTLGTEFKNLEELFEKSIVSKEDYEYAQSNYVLEAIVDELILEELTSKTGVTRDSEEYKSAITDSYNPTMKRDVLYELNLRKLLNM